jgi:hypothetical protein
VNDDMRLGLDCGGFNFSKHCEFLPTARGAGALGQIMITSSFAYAVNINRRIFQVKTSLGAPHTFSSGQ